MSTIKVDQLTDTTGTGSPTFPNGISASAIDSGVETNGKVLTANGSGGATWKSAAGGFNKKMYAARLSQYETDNPVATVIYNSLGQTVNWARIDTGVYEGSWSVPISTFLALVSLGEINDLSSPVILGAYQTNSTSVTVKTANSSGGKRDSALESAGFLLICSEDASS